MSATNDEIFGSPNEAEFIEQVSTAYLLLSTAITFADLNCLAKINDKMPLPQPKSMILRGAYYLLIFVNDCYNSFMYVSVVGSHTGPCGYILFLPNTETDIPFFLYYSSVFYLLSSFMDLNKL
mgnify:CR=1 FL=1|jgi:hypothetical protein